MPRLGDVRDDLIQALEDYFGVPAPSPSSDRSGPGMALVLTVFLAGQGKEREINAALDALAEAGLLDNPEALATANLAEIAAAWTRPNKPPPARTLRAFQRIAAWIAQLGGFDALESIPTEALRDGLLALNGVGPASADRILLFALKRPVYPIDRATYRIFVRHGWIDAAASYDEARDVVESLAPGDSVTLMRLSEWFEQIGAKLCRAAVAKCERCPLRPFLPEGGPIEPDSS